MTWAPLRWIAAVSAVVLLVGCSPAEPDEGGSGEGTSQPSSSPSATTPQEAPAQAEPIVGVGSMGGHEVEVSVAEIISDGEYAVLTMTAEGGPSVRLGIEWVEGVNANPFGASDLRLIDGEQVLLVARDAEGEPVASEGALDLSAGDQVITAVFAAPQGNDVDLLLKHVGLVADIPVVDVDALEIPDDVELSAGSSAATAPIESYSVDRAQESSTRISQGEATIAIESEVLFDVDSAELTSGAAAALARTAAQVQDAGATELEVVGHTDDRGARTITTTCRYGGLRLWPTPWPTTCRTWRSRWRGAVSGNPWWRTPQQPHARPTAASRSSTASPRQPRILRIPASRAPTATWRRPPVSSQRQGRAPWTTRSEENPCAWPWR